MAAKILETVVGLVEQVNANQSGIKVNGEWLNISQYHALAEIPTPGQRASVQVEKTDRGNWIQALEILDAGQVHQLPIRPGRGAGGRSPTDVREIRRLAVLKAAATFGASRPELKSADVLTLAERWLVWVCAGSTILSIVVS